MSHEDDCRWMLAEIVKNRFTFREFARSIDKAIFPFWLIISLFMTGKESMLEVCAGFPFFWLIFAYDWSDFFGRPFLVRAINTFLEKQHTMSSRERNEEYGCILKTFKMSRPFKPLDVNRDLQWSNTRQQTVVGYFKVGYHFLLHSAYNQPTK